MNMTQSELEQVLDGSSLPDWLATLACRFSKVSFRHDEANNRVLVAVFTRADGPYAIDFEYGTFSFALDDGGATVDALAAAGMQP